MFVLLYCNCVTDLLVLMAPRQLNIEISVLLNHGQAAQLLLSIPSPAP